MRWDRAAEEAFEPARGFCLCKPALCHLNLGCEIVSARPGIFMFLAAFPFVSNQVLQQLRLLFLLRLQGFRRNQ